MILILNHKEDPLNENTYIVEYAKGAEIHNSFYTYHSKTKADEQYLIELLEKK